MVGWIYIGILAVLSLFIPFAVLPSVAVAQSTENSDWSFHAAPYLWGSAVKGKVTVRGRDADVDKSFSDILDKLEGGAEVNLEAWKGRCGVYVDPIWLKLSSDTQVKAIDADFTMKQWLVDFGLACRLLDSEYADEKKQWFDLTAGGRYSWTKVNLDLTLPEPVTLERSFEKTKSFTDPVVGARYGIDLTKHVLFQVRGDVGGFDVSSKSTWSAAALLGYRVTKNQTAAVGYKALGYDREDDENDNKLKVTLLGPAVGYDIRF